MADSAAGSVEELAFHARNKRVLTALAVQALFALAWAARTQGRRKSKNWRTAERGNSLEGCLLPVAVQCLPVVADAGEHGAAGRVQNEGPYGHSVAGLGPACGAYVEAVGGSSSDGAVGSALVAVHDELGVVRDGLVAQVAAPIRVAGRFAGDADQTMPLPAVERQSRRHSSCQLGIHGSAGTRGGNSEAGLHGHLAHRLKSREAWRKHRRLRSLGAGWPTLHVKTGLGEGGRGLCHLLAL